MNRFKKIWKDPVGSKLIAAAIIAIASPIIIYFWSVAKQISFKESFFSVISLFNISVTVPLWVIILVSFLILILFLSRKDKNEPKLIDFQMVEEIGNEASKEFLAPGDTSKTEQPLSGKKSISTFQEEKASTHIGQASTVFFHERICDSFPGVETYEWIEDPYKAIERLSILLKPPISFDHSKGHGVSSCPIWWFRGLSALHIEKFERIDSTHCLIDHYLLNIKKIAIVRSGSYYQNFVYIETNKDEPIGLYEHQPEEFLYENTREVLREEYGLFNNIPISRREYDDGVSEINGQVINTQGSELRIRFLTPYNFIISSQFSPYNSNKLDIDSEEYFYNLLLSKIDFSEFVEFMSRFPKHPND
jgi:uncharacterized membrane protein